MRNRSVVTGLCLGLAVSAVMMSGAQAQCIAKGHGFVRYEGSGVFQLTGGNGVLKISQHPHYADAPPANVLFGPAVTKPGDGDFIEPVCLPDGSGGCLYRMSGALARIEGTGLLVSFAGANIGLKASGDALLTLQGYGMYVMDGVLGRWTMSGTTVEVSKDPIPTLP